MSHLQRVLLVSFFYPPHPAVGGLRIAKFARYLPEFGWEPTVLTAHAHAAAGSDDSVHATRFHSPWKHLQPPSAGVERKARPSLAERAARGPIRRRLYSLLRHVLPMSSVRMPDATFSWIRPAVAEGRRVIETTSFDAIFSSAGPPSSHRVAARLQRLSGLPWIADYRDLWSGNHWDSRVAPFRWAERRYERRALRGASLLTTVSPPLAEQLTALHQKPTEVVFNGFDPSDYPSRPGRDDGFSLTYVGSLYWPDQDPRPLFDALTIVQQKHGIDLDALRFRLQFVGTEPSAFSAAANRHGVARWIRFLPPTSHTHSLELQARSTALLFLGWNDPMRGILSAKLFEYLGAGRPILSVGPAGGAATAILQSCGLPDLSDAPQALAERLSSWFREFARSGSLASDRPGAAAAAYTRRAQTGVLAGLLDRVATGVADGY